MEFSIPLKKSAVEPNRRGFDPPSRTPLWWPPMKTRYGGCYSKIYNCLFTPLWHYLMIRRTPTTKCNLETQKLLCIATFTVAISNNEVHWRNASRATIHSCEIERERDGRRLQPDGGKQSRTESTRSAVESDGWAASPSTAHHTVFSLQSFPPC
jgi:hypothetical protein